MLIMRIVFISICQIHIWHRLLQGSRMLEVSADTSAPLTEFQGKVLRTRLHSRMWLHVCARRPSKPVRRRRWTESVSHSQLEGRQVPLPC